MKFEKIYIELSDICGLKCDFCPSQKGVRGVMNLINFEKILPKISNRAKLFTCHILGDPLLVPEFEKYLQMAANFKMRLEITTSGFYLSQKNINLLLAAPSIHQINISLMSALSPQNTKKMSFEKYFNGILNFIKAHQNAKNDAFVNLRLWNLDFNFSPPLQNEKIYFKLREEFGLKDDFKALRIRIARKVFLHQNRLFKWASLDEDVLNLSQKKESQKSSKPYCYALSKQFGILSDGSLVPCCLDVKPHISFGNLFHQSLDEIFQNKRLIKMREGFKNGILSEPLCKNCEFVKLRLS